MKKSLIFILSLMLLLQVGCMASESPDDLAKLEEGEYVPVQLSSDERLIVDRSEMLADAVVELFGIDDAASIIYNETAFVSVIMAYDAEFDDDTKALIKDTVMATDHGITEVVVTNDENAFFKTVDIVSDIIRGSKYDDYTSDISKLINKFD